MLLSPIWRCEFLTERHEAKLANSLRKRRKSCFKLQIFPFQTSSSIPCASIFFQNEINSLQNKLFQGRLYTRLRRWYNKVDNPLEVREVLS